jgi:predicted molibdopterin-dependent oxidoreductase YjgC
MDEIVGCCQLLAYSSYEGGSYMAPETKRPDVIEAQSDSYWGVGRIHGGQFPEGFARFCPVEYVPPAKAKKGYPFTLLAGTVVNHFGTGSRSSRSARLKKFCPEAFVEICESDARKLAITNGEQVKVISAVGEVMARVKITDALVDGMLFMPVSFPEAPVNELFDIVLDAETKAPSLKACSVKIEKIPIPLGDRTKACPERSEGASQDG